MGTLSGLGGLGARETGQRAQGQSWNLPVSLKDFSFPPPLVPASWKLPFIAKGSFSFPGGPTGTPPPAGPASLALEGVTHLVLPSGSLRTGTMSYKSLQTCEKSARASVRPSGGDGGTDREVTLCWVDQTTSPEGPPPHLTSLLPPDP